MTECHNATDRKPLLKLRNFRGETPTLKNCPTGMSLWVSPRSKVWRSEMSIYIESHVKHSDRLGRKKASFRRARSSASPTDSESQGRQSSQSASTLGATLWINQAWTYHTGVRGSAGDLKDYWS